MPSGSTKQVTTASNEPWEPTQPILKKVLNTADDMYDDGYNKAFDPYTESLVVPFSQQTKQGMNAIESGANAAMGSGVLNNPMDFLSGLYGQGGLSADQRGVADQWRNTASGAELASTSPHFEDLLQRSLGDARTGVDLSISGSGRYGSGMHTDVLGDTLGGISSAARQGEWGRQLGRQDTARTNLAGLGQQGIANLFGAGAAMPEAWTTGQLPATDLMKVGAMNEHLNARQLADKERIYRETKRAPLDAVEWLNAISSGAGSLGGTQMQTTQMPSPNPFLQAGAGVLGLNSLFNNPLGSFF